ncbi:hypothetical protein CTI12_AA023480 [Artemisia annua]|uniref:Pre-mRNA processing factor 4 (PRP4)-like domain-containing protein n=1 Tax=Artemisia annua TaxID=35608 RepID=A0A2U1QJ41_ARTAN|nr:hypothetical protein CTI12_AA023480 [Artemisia annua]
MDIDEELNPNPNSNSTLSPPNIITPTEPSLPPIVPIPTPAVPPIAPIPRLPIRPINGETAKKDDSNDEDDDSGLEYEVSEESRLFREKQEKVKLDFLMKQRAAALAVPTNDKAVRSRLRRLGEPVTLFGEREMERRGRLRMIMARLDSQGQLETEIGDDRPLSGCSFSSDGKFLATCSLTAVGKIWSMPEVKIVSSLKGHTERATDITFSPTNNHIATASADRTARLWNTEGTLLNTYKGHLDRLARVAFHPSGKYLVTYTWVEKSWQKSLLGPNPVALCKKSSFMILISLLNQKVMKIICESSCSIGKNHDQKQGIEPTKSTVDEVTIIEFPCFFKNIKVLSSNMGIQTNMQPEARYITIEHHWLNHMLNNECCDNKQSYAKHRESV